MKLVQLAAATASTISRGSGDTEITSAAGLDIAKVGDVTFLANPKYTPQIKVTSATAIFLSENVEIDSLSEDLQKLIRANAPGKNDCTEVCGRENGSRQGQHGTDDAGDREVGRR